MATIFCSNFGFLQQKDLCADKGILFSLFMFSKKKKKKGHQSERSTNILVFYWLCAVNKGVALQTEAAYGFRQEIKIPVFGKRKNVELRNNSVQKCRKKFRTFLCL